MGAGPQVQNRVKSKGWRVIIIHCTQNNYDLTPLANSLNVIMSRIITVLTFLAPLLLLCTSGRAQQNYHQNPQTFSVNRLPPHATLYRFADETAAKTGSNLVGRTDLNGPWLFEFHPKGKAGAPLDYTAKNTSDYSHNVMVPGNWEMYGFGSPMRRRNDARS